MGRRSTAIILIASHLFCIGLVSSIGANAIINEFMAENATTLADEDGDFEDWIEIYNPAAGTINLDGWYLTDDARIRTKWRFPAVMLDPGRFLVVFASGKDRKTPPSPLHTNFKLDKNGGYLALVMADGRTTTSEFAPAYPRQRQDISYGRAQNSTNLVSKGAMSRYLVPLNNTFETTWFTLGFDDSSWAIGSTGLGFYNSPTPAAYWTFDAGATDSVGTNHGTLLNGAGIAPSSAVGPGALLLDGSDDYVAIGNPLGLQITGQITIAAWIQAYATDGFRNIVAKGYSTSPNGEIYLRISNGIYQIGSWNGLDHLANAAGASADVGSWVHLAGTYDGTKWNLYRNGLLVSSAVDAVGAVAVNESWAIGARGTGTERFFNGLVDDVRIYNTALNTSEVASLATFPPDIATNVKSVMQNVNASLWSRIEFNIANPGAIDSLLLRMKYEDGFVAYLNGIEIARRNAPDTVLWNSAAASNRPNEASKVFEEINIANPRGTLRAGRNVLAVQSLNDILSDGDFLFLPELLASSEMGIFGYFTAPTPGTANGRSYSDLVADPQFNVGRGFYNSPVALQIACETKGTTIVYTTNGSAPTLNNGTRVAAPNAFTSATATLNITKTTAVRAAAFKGDCVPSRVETHTYIFVSDVVFQDYQATLNAGFPSTWNGTAPDYGMDPDVIGQSGQDLFGGVYAASIRNDLKAAPTLSIVMNIDDMFGPAGIYSNPTRRGAAWEKPTSFELIYPDGQEGFQVNAGIQIQGGAFRSFGLTKKKSLRLLFKGIYGPTKLNYSLFGPAAVGQFDTIVLRMNANDGYQWSSAGNKAQYIRDEFGRRTQLATGQPSGHGNFMHVYINGFYWGLYNPVERPDTSFASMYCGGKKENWDLINTGGVVEGDQTAWNAMLTLASAVQNGATEPDRTAAYERIQGNNPDGTRNPAWEDYLDVDNLIDYMIVNFYGGNTDWPHRNYYYARERGPGSTGFKFFMWDSEWSLGLQSDVNTDRTGVTAGVAQPYARLRPSAEFRLHFADHVHKHFFNGGALYVDPARSFWDPAHPERNVPAARYAQIANEIRDAVVGESARWGDQHRSLPYTRNAEWQTELTNLLYNYFPNRSAKVLQQFRNAGLYPNVVAPAFWPQHGGVVPAGFQLTISAPTGTIYYTVDGSDPRRIGGAISPSARMYIGPLTLNDSTFVSARVLDWGNWSALNSAGYTVLGASAEVTVSEVMHNPSGSSDYEYIELHNPSGSRPAVLDGYTFTNGINFTFPARTAVPPGGYLLVVKGSSAGNFAPFRAYYGLGSEVPIVGPYALNLNNAGERVTLSKSPGGATVLSFEYSDARGWPVAANGAGHSLVPIQEDNQPGDSLDYGGNWRASAFIKGSPGKADPVHADVLLNEIVAHTDVNVGLYHSNDAIEILNTSNSLINMADWYLSDDKANLAKWPIGSAGTSIPACGRLLFDEIHHFNSPIPGRGFSISEGGGEIYLSCLPAGQPSLRRVADAVRFKGQERSVSLSRFPDGGQFWYATAISTGTVNTPPLGDIVISEFMYNPGANQSYEFIELYNPTGSSIRMENGAGQWRINGGVDFAFPAGVTIAPGGFLALVPFHPVNDATSMTLFRSRYSLAAGEPAQVFGPYSGRLSNKGDRIALERPQSPQYVGDVVSWVIVDESIYFHGAPWTAQADGTGMSLNRVAINRSGNDPDNWCAGPPTPGRRSVLVSVALESENVADGGLTKNASANFTATFSRPVNGFAASDLQITNGSISFGSFSGGNGDNLFRFAVRPVADGLVTVHIPAGVAAAADNATTNLASLVFTFTYDGTPPTASPPWDEGVFSNRTNITFRWIAPYDMNGIASVVLHVGTAVGLSDVAIMDVTGMTSREVIAPNGATIYARLVVTDYAGNAATTGDSDGITINAGGVFTGVRIPWLSVD